MKRAHQVRRATNLSIDAGLAAEAKRLEWNLSQILEERLRELLAAERRRQWLTENATAFAAYARFVEARGLFNEGDREW